MAPLSSRLPLPLSGKGPHRWRRMSAAAAVVTAGAMIPMSMTIGASASPGFKQTTFNQINLVSDQAGVAPLTDPDLVNAWGLSFSPGTDAKPGSPLWVSDNGTDKTTLYAAGSTATTVSKVGLTVNIASGAPTGTVFNGTGTFTVTDAAGRSGSALFIFDGENGGIDGWNPAVGTATPPSTVTEAPVNNGANAVYKGLAMADTSDGMPHLYAANFRSGRVEAYDRTFKPVVLSGGLFVDHHMPAGFAPFGIQELNGKLYVSYAKQDDNLQNPVNRLGNGFVDVFTNDGTFVRRLISRGVLDSPWGMIIAPSNFGSFAGDLLVGNFGNGWINAFDPNNGGFRGALRLSNGHPIIIPGLWDLKMGNGNAAKTEEMLFSAGPDHETHGLLGKLVVAG